MIRTIQDLTNNIFSNYSDIQDKPINPCEGDVYYDDNKKVLYQYHSGKWLKLRVHNKDVFINRRRKYKIKNIFNELY